MDKTILLGCALLALAAPAAAEVYKWVDADGQTHYGERPPQAGKAQALPSALAGPAPAAESRSNWQQQEQAFQRRRIEAERKEAQGRQQAAALKQACNEARDHLAQMKTASRVYRLNQNGERVYESDEDRNASIARLEQQVADRCR